MGVFCAANDTEMIKCKILRPKEILDSIFRHFLLCVFVLCGFHIDSWGDSVR